MNINPVLSENKKNIHEFIRYGLKYLFVYVKYTTHVIFLY